MHCLVEFHDNKKAIFISDDLDGGWELNFYSCPACKRMNMFLINGTKVNVGPGKFSLDEIKSSTPIRPIGSNRLPCPPEVPPQIAEDYIEACKVLSLSPKASAALSRRCLQNLLRDATIVEHGNLYNEIQGVIDSGILPTHLVEIIDLIRVIGNFAAHPTKSKNTGEIIDVEPDEAEWNLEVLELLFDFFYVQPVITAKKKEGINKKLIDAGKTPI